MDTNNNKRAKIIIAPGGGEGDMRYVRMDGIDFENSGKMNMSEINMKNTGYINEKEGTTNIEGKINTDGFIINRGIFNVKKSGRVNIELQKIYKEHPILFWVGVVASIFDIITGIVYLYIVVI